MNNQDEDKILNDLYQQANQELPPAALDDLILKQAQQAKQIDSKASSTIKTHWRPWLAAASVVLVIPMIWLLTQNPQLSQDMGQIENPVVQPKVASDTTPQTEKVMANDAGMEAELAVPTKLTQSAETEQAKSTTASSARQEPAAAPAPMADLQEIIEQQGQRAITGNPINQESLQANKALLMNEFKAKKRSIKPSTMDPLMALEYEQFGRYLQQGEIEAADQLLTEMQERWPEFDYEDMIYRLAAAEAAN